ncbi:MAG: hypothetical protein HBSAPP02_18400 [Phycisphaerae bacterium]|nr:MAG: VanZ family protein [Planctomycetia bacterium]RIK69596.1 MAG: hypothetical protein DCC66_08485 [Planctomycetota bacterium]GJQ26808.1 MAG: hypothetical protein HBSAPP02_18400 [Phycisphaerae bacterium]
MNLQSRRMRTALCVCLFVGAFVMSHTPPPPPPSRPPINDKVMHFTGFVLLGMVTIWRGLDAGRRYPLRGALGWLLLLALYAAFDELTQPIMGRSCELFDWVADVGGAIAGITIILVLHQRSVARPT